MEIIAANTDRPTLREIRDPRQHDGEPHRRIFFCHEADLVVWGDDFGLPESFELSYLAGHRQKSLRWDGTLGLQHFNVESRKGTPILTAETGSEPDKVTARFAQTAATLPEDLRTFVFTVLELHSDMPVLPASRRAPPDSSVMS